MSAMLGDGSRRDRPYPSCLRGMKARPADGRVDRPYRHARHALRRACLREELARDRDRYLISRADGDNAGNDLLERRVEAVFGQLEERGFGKMAHGGANAAKRRWEIESSL